MRKFLFSLLIAISFATTSWAATQAILVRHGQTDWNKEKKVQGQTDIPLNETGMAQAKMLAEKIFENYPLIDAIYSSDLKRAYDTALATAEKFNLPVHKKTGLREMNWGELEGRLVNGPDGLAAIEREKQLDKGSSERQKLWDEPFVSGSESFNQNLSRIKQELLEIARNHPDQSVLVFSHGRTIKTLFLDISGDVEPLHLSNCGMMHVIVDLENLDHPITFIKTEQLID